MSTKFIIAATLMATFASGAFAQTAKIDSAGESKVDCKDEANKEDEACLGLPDAKKPITNFAPVIGPLLGAAALSGLGGGKGSTTSTPSTPSTTN